MVNEAAHVLEPHQRQELAEFGAGEIAEHTTVAGLLGRHLSITFAVADIARATLPRGFDRCGSPLLLVADRKGEDFLLGQIGEALHHAAGPIQ